jgi:UDP-N-acetylmuramoyl-tripeptide--D-alanyl-D-alanine ligase
MAAQRISVGSDAFSSIKLRILSHAFSLATVATLLGIVAISFAVVNMKTPSLVFSYFSLAAYAAHYAWNFWHRGISRPELTPKAIAIITVAVILELTLVASAWGLLPTELLAVAANIIVLITCPLAIGAIHIPSAWQKQHIITQAQEVRQKLNQLTVIGITGSFGKSSTKHFAYQLLQTQFPQTLVTPGHINTEIGVAQHMLRHLDPKTAVYVVEMGAYKSGEISALAKLTRPSVGVITSIGNQHLALFGSLEAIATTKWELIDGLPEGGVAVLNADAPALQEKAQMLTQQIVWFSVNQPAQVYASHIQLEARATSFQLHMGEARANLTITMPSRAMLSSVVAASAAAYALGVSAQDIFSAIPTLKPFPQTMEIKRGKNNATIIDDSYGANEQGVLEALAAIQRFPEKDKRIVLTPLIELGSEAIKTHERISQALGSTAATVFINGTAYKSALKKYAPHLQFFSDPKQLASAVRRDVSANTVILFEGRLPDVVGKQLLHPSS